MCARASTTWDLIVKLPRSLRWSEKHCSDHESGLRLRGWFAPSQSSGDSPQSIVEFGKRNGGRFGVLNRRRTIGRQSCHRERHGDPMIAERIEFGGMELLFAGH